MININIKSIKYTEFQYVFIIIQSHLGGEIIPGRQIMLIISQRLSNIVFLNYFMIYLRQHSLSSQVTKHFEFLIK